MHTVVRLTPDTRTRGHTTQYIASMSSGQKLSTAIVPTLTLNLDIVAQLSGVVLQNVIISFGLECTGFIRFLKISDLFKFVYHRANLLPLCTRVE